MDYWERLQVTVHDDDDAFFRTIADTPVWLFTSKAECSCWEADFEDGDVLIFGSETRGISERVRSRHPGREVRIPQVAGERCLNLSTAVGIGLYEALRRVTTIRGCR
jgi:tRNA (cytidine/uridine-2'-O-)-methyltransferase